MMHPTTPVASSDHYHLAQVNTATLRFPLHTPQMAEFTAQIQAINAVADADPGFVWRLRGDGEADATSIRAFDDERILITLTVWRSLEALANYVYRSAHAGVMRDRRRWFEKSEQPILALWWIAAGHLPTVAEAKERLEHLRCHGSTPYAFSFHRPFPSPDCLEVEPISAVAMRGQDHRPSARSTPVQPPRSTVPALNSESDPGFGRSLHPL